MPGREAKPSARGVDVEEIFSVLALPEEAPWVFDVRSGRVELSPAFAAILGYPAERRGIDLAEFEALLFPDDLAALRKARQAFLETGDAFTLRYRITDRTGRLRWLHDRAHGYRTGPDGAPHILVGTVRDISARRDLVERLRQSERRFTDMVKNVPGAIFRYLVHPDGRDEVQYMSPGCLDLWEVPSEAVHEDAGVLWAMIDPDDLPAMRQSVMESAEREMPWTFTWRITTPSGKRKWLRGSGQPQRTPDGSVLWNSLILDATAEKQREAEINQARAVAVEANQAKSRFLASVSHELRTPLNAIIGYSEIMEQRIFGPVGNEKYREYTHDILMSSRFLLSLIDDLLDLTEFETAKKAIDLAPVEIAPLVRDLSALFDAAVWSRIDVSLAGAPVVHGNERAVKQVLINILKNAVSFAETRVGFAVFERDGRVVFEVSDDGPGMTDKEAELVFEPFYTGRTDDAFKKIDRAGFGIGLTVSRNLVEKMGGAIAIDSVPGQGTKVAVEIPVEGAEVPS
ncbi:MAG: PAS domain-containing protein [Alphaproteobacteria bacterium]|nr:PAS domain-containing protein [Alphaproteobacteria bacterium]